MTQDVTRRRQELEEAFELFNQVSERLASSYQNLEERIVSLNAELAAARSERLQQLAEKERLANKLQRILEALPGGVVVVNGEGIIEESNPVAETLLGEALQGKSWEAVSRQAFGDVRAYPGDISLVDGRHISISVRELELEPGRILLIKDVTETHRLHEMLNRHKRLSAMGEMVASLAHQIRTPLTSALLYVSQIADGNLPDEERSRFVGKVLSRLHYLEHMVNDMLVFARGGEVGDEEFLVEAVIADLTQILEPQLHDKRINFVVDNQSKGVCLKGNREGLVGALLNIVNNAIQACKVNPLIRLELALQPPNTLVISISDNGQGMAEHALGKIFEPFFTTKKEGTGLGLAVAQAVVLAHQGEITVESVEGKGARFTIRLPVAGYSYILPSAKSQQLHASAMEAGGILPIV